MKSPQGSSLPSLSYGPKSTENQTDKQTVMLTTNRRVYATQASIQEDTSSVSSTVCRTYYDFKPGI